MPVTDYHIIFSTRVVNDLQDIGNYITFVLLEPDISRNFIKGLHKSISRLSIFPYMFPLVPDNILHNKATRRMPYKNYLIYYSVVETMHIIVVHRIVSSKRDPRNF